MALLIKYHAFQHWASESHKRIRCYFTLLFTRTQPDVK